MTHPLRPTTIFEAHGSRPYLIGGRSDASWTYRQFAGEIESLATCLRSFNIGKGNRIAALLDNSPELVTLYFASLALGATLVPINPSLHPTDITYIVEHADTALTVLSSSTRDLFESAAPGNTNPILLLCDEGTNGWVMTSGKRESSGAFFSDVSLDDLWTITFTSGTTSRPKGVPHRVRSLFSSAEAFSRAVGYTEQTRLHHVMPMSYMAGFLNTLLCPFVVGAAVVLDRPFDARLALDYWSIPIKHQVNRLCLVPTMLSMLLHVDRSERGPNYCRSDIEAISVCTAPLPATVKLDFEARYGVTLLESYGLSETLFATTQRPGLASKLNSVGSPLPGISLDIRDDHGHPLPRGESGEIYIRAESAMAGYLHPETALPDPATAPAWFPTGDVGYLDADGDLCITGRKKDLIIRGGINISPRAIEEILLTDPRVRDAAVIGTPHPILGEEIIAIIEPAAATPGVSLRADLKALCQSKLAASSQPNRFLELDELPRTTTGKVIKTRLREILSRALAGELVS